MTRNVFSTVSPFDMVIQTEKQKELLSRAVDLPGIFNVLYDLFKSLGLFDSTAQIGFKYSYPDDKFDDDSSSVVVFDLVERKKLTLKTTAGNIVQEKPRLVTSDKNIITGQKEEVYSNSYENLITLEVFSTSSERLYQLLTYLESVFTKYDGHLQKYFTRLLYLGITSGSGNAANLFKNRMFSKTIHLKIYTEASYTLQYEEIQKINHTIS